jgi:hypothetical protein
MSRSVLLKVGFLSGLDGDVAGFWRCYLGTFLTQRRGCGCDVLRSILQRPSNSQITTVSHFITISQGFGDGIEVAT